MWRVDANHHEIVAVLRQLGCAVLDLARVGGGCPDLLVYDRRRECLVLVEIKNKKAKGKLNKLQQIWHDKWLGPKPLIIHSVEETLAAFGPTVAVVHTPDEAIAACAGRVMVTRG